MIDATAPILDAGPLGSAEAVLSKISDALGIFDTEWRFTYVNEQAVRLGGIARAEMVGRLLWDVFPQLKGTRLERMLRRSAQKQKPLEFEYFEPSRDAWYEVRIHPSADGTLVFVRDVSEKRQAQKERDELQTRFARFTENLPGLAWMKDAEGRYVFVNEAAAKAFKGARAEILGKTDFEIFPEAIARAFRDNDARALASGSGIVTLETLDHEDGVSHHSVVSKFPVASDSGLLVGGVAIDITERIRAEQHLGAILSSIGDHLVSYDRSWRFTHVNPLAAKALESTPEELLGKCIWDLFPEEVGKQYYQELHKAVETGRHVHYEHYYEPHGKWLENFIYPAESGVTVFSYDITERVQLEQRLEAVLASIGDHLVTYDKEWRYTYVNDGAAATLGKSKEELLGQCIWELFPEAVGNQYHQDLMQVAQTGEPVRSEHYYAPFDTWFENFIYPSANGVTVFSTDVTWRKKLQAELEERAKELAEADRRKDEFLAMLGHELRNPLAPLSNALQILKIRQGDPEAFEKTRQLMERQLGQMVRLIEDLLDVSRITQGRLELRSRPMKLQEALQMAAESSMPFIEALGHRFHVDLPADPIELEGDAARLAQVFMNLLNNAARYTAPGGDIWLTVSRGSDAAVVSVRDNGLGIDPSEVKDVFDMFVQVGKSSGEHRQGLGLGLTLVKRLVEMHGGTVSANSPGIGYGSQFIVRLPLPNRNINPI